MTNFFDHFGIRPSAWCALAFANLMLLLGTRSSPASCCLWAALFALLFHSARVEFLWLEHRRRVLADALRSSPTAAASMAWCALRDSLR